MEEKKTCPHCHSVLEEGEACGCPGAKAELEAAAAKEEAIQKGVAAEVRIVLEKLPGEATYRRSMEASNTIAIYNGLGVLIRDAAKMMDQPLDHVVAVLATVLLGPEAIRQTEGGS